MSFLIPRLYPALFLAHKISDFVGARVRLGVQPSFCRGAEEFGAFAESLRHRPCPHCHVVGMLIRHGSLFGFDESTPGRKTVRARRVFCSNRNSRRGCGRTFSVWCADKIRRLSVTTHAVWSFLQLAVAGSVAAAIRAADFGRSDTTWRRLWKRFNLGQSKIRTALLGRCPPPQVPAESAQRPAAQVVAHLQAAFPDGDCPIAAFQHALRSFFM
jgi:hypothetical protein